MQFREVDLKEYIKMLYKNRNIFFGVVLTVLVFTAVFTISSTKIYEAKTTIMFSGGDSSQSISFGGISIPIPGGGSKKDGGGSSGSIAPSFGSFASKIFSAKYNRTIMQSRTVRLALAKKLNLYKEYNLKDDQGGLNSPAKEAIVGIIASNTSLNVNDDGMLVITAKASAAPFSNKTEQKRAAELAAAIANGYVEVMKDYNNNNRITGTIKRRKFVEEQLKEKKQDLNDLSKQMEEFIAAHKIFDIETHTRNLEERVGFMERALNDCEIDINQLKISLDNMKKELTAQLRLTMKDFDNVNASVSPTLKKIQEELINKQVNLMLASHGRTGKHPVVSKINQEMASLESSYREMAQKYIKNLNSNFPAEFVELQTKYFLAEARREALKKNREEFNKNITGAPQVILDYMELRREFDTKKITCAMLEQDLESTKIAEAQEAPDMEVVDAAVPPESKSYPKTKTNLMIGLLFGIILGLISSVSWEYLDKNLVNDIIKRVGV